jgi:hypothetical protein
VRESGPRLGQGEGHGGIVVEESWRHGGGGIRDAPFLRRIPMSGRNST